MNSILDASVLTDVFGHNRTPAGEHFLDLIHNNQARLVVGGELLRELCKNVTFRIWIAEEMMGPGVTRVNDSLVEAETDKLISDNSCRSNDEHVIALARLSGARVLFADDQLLRDDFRNPDLINNPRGKLLPTGASKKAMSARRNLFMRKQS